MYWILRGVTVACVRAVCVRVWVGDIFSLESLILAQDERWLQA